MTSSIHWELSHFRRVSQAKPISRYGNANENLCDVVGRFASVLFSPFNAMAALSYSGALPERSDSFRYAAYVRKPTAVADSIKVLAEDSSLTNFPFTKLVSNSCMTVLYTCVHFLLLFSLRVMMRERAIRSL